MRCDDVREVLSARLDGERPPGGTDERAVDHHVAGCAACTTFARAATAHHRATRVRPAEAVPDLTEAILARTAPLHPQPVREWARYALFVVAATQVLLAVPAVLSGDGAAAIHATRELAGSDIAVAVGFLWAAWQPRRAVGLLPLAAALAGMMFVTAVLDVAASDAGALGEAHHVLDLAGVGFLWALAHPARPRPDHLPAAAIAA